MANINDIIAMNLARCHKSVVQTKKVVEPKNLGIVVPSLYLFFQDISGLQNLGGHLPKTESSK